MKLARWLIPIALGFSAGAMLAPRGGGTSLREALQSSPLRNLGTTPRRAALGEQTDTLEERFGQLLSPLHETSSLKRRHDLWEALAESGESEIVQLLGRAERLPAQFRMPVTVALLERWFELNPEAASKWARGQPLDHYSWEVWVMRSPESAMIALQEAAPAQPRTRRLLELAVATIAGPEKAARAAKLTALPASPTRDLLLSSVLNDWSTTDPGAAFAFSRDTLTGALRPAALQTALRELATKDAAHAQRELATVLSELPPGENGNPAIAAVAAALARKDPQATLQWIGTLPEAHRGSALYTAAAAEWAKINPSAAITWHQGSGLTGGLPRVVDAAMETRSAETLQWIQGMPPGPARDAFLEAAVSNRGLILAPQLSSENIRTVAALLAQLPAEAQERASARIGWHGATSSQFETVLPLVREIANPQARAAAIKAATRARGSFRRDSANLMHEYFPDPADRDAAFRGLSASQRSSAPQAAAASAMQIADPTSRFQAMDEFVVDWLDRKPADARAWLSSTETIPREWAAAWLEESDALR
ncbi:MAG TPA: hypothetical protein VF593_08760 [Chthoniobacteraceae bacterium]|jgi:hypothetical protein